MYDVTIVGGGIIGLSVGWAITRRSPGLTLLVLEKEGRWGYHQTGHNSGEIHSGLYYQPGSLKARLCREGNRRMFEFCRDYGIPHERCGKVIVATEDSELSELDWLQERAVENGVPVQRLNREALREIEPHCGGLAALHVPSTGIVDYQQVAAMFAELIQKSGGALKRNSEVQVIVPEHAHLRVETSTGAYDTRFLINCAGLQSDRIAKLMGLRTGMLIVPIRGEYYRVVDEKRHLVRTLIYPLPNRRYPFLGAHFTRQLDGRIRVGPSAVLTLRREGYDGVGLDWRDAGELCASSAFWRFVAANWRQGGKEWMRSLSKRLLVRRLQKLVPELRAGDLIARHIGIRAQAIRGDGRITDDFVILHGPRSIHVCNAPSPAATASIPIGDAIVDRLHEQGVR
ncbi:L-2-hydroxyglutarate oxidase [Candidatus Nitrospira bockiana]